MILSQLFGACLEAKTLAQNPLCHPTWNGGWLKVLVQLPQGTGDKCQVHNRVLEQSLYLRHALIGPVILAYNEQEACAEFLT